MNTQVETQGMISCHLLYRGRIDRVNDIKGQVRTWFSLELVSIGGEIHFFIWGRRKFADLIETQIYSQ